MKVLNKFKNKNKTENMYQTVTEELVSLKEEWKREKFSDKNTFNLIGLVDWLFYKHVLLM